MRDILLTLALVIALIQFSPAAHGQADDSYDPFADFSEFEDTEQERDDLNFFQNGRQLTLGFMGGYRAFTSGMSQIYGNGPTFGLALTYFFDLNFALQIGFVTGDYQVRIPSDIQTFEGNLSFTEFAFDIKYYLNTRNIKKKLAVLNPYFLVGMSQNFRTVTIETEDYITKSQGMGIDVGGGIEVPIMRNKMFTGLQVTYHLVSFADEKSEIVFPDENDQPIHTGIRPNGDTYKILGILGINF